MSASCDARSTDGPARESRSQTRKYTPDEEEGEGKEEVKRNDRKREAEEERLRGREEALFPRWLRGCLHRDDLHLVLEYRTREVG